MDADYDIRELVKVIRDFWLLDAESYQRSYCTSHGNPLEPGFYVVSWPDKVRDRRFNEEAAFHGPFSLREHAQKFLEDMNRYKYVLIMPSKKWGRPADTFQIEKKVA
jgi:hypothetical protein